MDRFLDRSAFAGAAFDASRARGSVLGAAQFNGRLACTNWRRAAVEALLPPELALAPNLSSTPDVHPLVWLFGELCDRAMLFGGMRIAVDERYSEFGLFIPYVAYGAAPHLHTYVLRMCSSYFPPVRDGNVHYGFHKQLAVLQEYGPIVTLIGPHGELLWQATVETTGAWDLASGTQQATLQAAFRLPLLGRKQNGRYVRSRLDFSFRGTLVRPLRCAMSIEAPLVQGLAGQRCYGIAGATYEVRRMLWHLSWPEPL